MQKINGAVLHSLINSVYLDGIIHEAVMCVEDNEATIQAVDPTNCLLVNNSLSIEMPDTTLGITDLRIVMKVLNDNAEVQYEIKSNDDEQQWMHFRVKGKGTTKFLLAAPDQITTRVKDTNACDELLGMYENSADITKQAIDDLFYFINIFKPLFIQVRVEKHGVIKIRTPSDAQNQFQIPFATFEPDTYDPFTLEIYAKHFIAILKHIRQFKDPGELILLDAQNPVIVMHENCVWACSPIT